MVVLKILVLIGLLTALYSFVLMLFCFAYGMVETLIDNIKKGKEKNEK